MRKDLKYLFPLLFSMGCISHQEESLPISEEKLEAVLLDIHVAESAMAKLQIGPQKDSLANLYYDQISTIHQVDRETIDTCLAILQRNPEMMNRIYEKLSETAEKKAFGK